jgi:group I intron endonuclease
MHYIYLITNLISGKIYIGQTKDPNRRWRDHQTASRKKEKNQIISKAMNKYGCQNFIFDIIATCKNQEDADAVEEVIILQYNSRDLSIGYNLKAGGSSSKHSESSIKKISQSSIGKPGTNTGKKFSDEWRIKISKSQIGKARKHKRKFSEEIEKEICRLYIEESKSAYFIAKKYDCHRSLINAILNRNNIAKRKTNYNKNIYKKYKFSPKQEQEMCDIYLSGNVSRADIAKKFKCNTNTITAILSRHNIKS